MIVCRECGEHQEPGSAFCTRCGSFLEWDGVQANPDPAATAPVAAEPDSAPEQTPSATAAEQAPAPAAAAAAPEDGYTRQPQRGHRPDRTPAPRKLDRPSGTLICGRCATGNDPSRRFCSRCGNSLADAQVHQRPPWWRRLLFTERSYAAGDRRRPRRRLRGVARIVLLLLVVGLVLLLVGPLRQPIVRLYDDLTGRLDEPVPVRPEVVTASGATGKHPARLAFDGAKNTYWAAPRKGVPSLRAQFARPTDVVNVGITAGVSAKNPEFLTGPRPKLIQVQVFTGDQLRAARLELADKPGFQQFTLDFPDVRALLFRVVASNGSTRSVSTAVSEIEVFARPE